MLFGVIAFAALLVYFLGWSALLYAALGLAFICLIVWIFDALTLMKSARESERPVGSFFFHMSQAWRLAKEQHTQGKASAAPTYFPAATPQPIIRSIEDLSDPPKSAAPFLSETRPAETSRPLDPVPGSVFHAFTNLVKSQKSTPAAATAHAETVSLPCTFSFTYADSMGATEQRTVDVKRISSNDRYTYLEGYCHARKEARTFRTDRIRGSLTDMDSGELIPVKRLLSKVRERTNMTFKPEAATRPAATQAKEWQTAVLFTGFAAARRSELEELAYAAGWDVRSTVGSTLDYLVIGSRAGQSKVAKAEELGVCVIDEELFRGLV